MSSSVRTKLSHPLPSPKIPLNILRVVPPTSAVPKKYDRYLIHATNPISCLPSGVVSNKSPKAPQGISKNVPSSKSATEYTSYPFSTLVKGRVVSIVKPTKLIY